MATIPFPPKAYSIHRSRSCHRSQFAMGPRSTVTTRVSLRNSSDTRCCCMLVVAGVVRHIQGILFVCSFVRLSARDGDACHATDLPSKYIIGVSKCCKLCGHLLHFLSCNLLQCTSLAPNLLATLRAPTNLTKMQECMMILVGLSSDKYSVLERRVAQRMDRGPDSAYA